MIADTPVHPAPPHSQPCQRIPIIWDHQLRSGGSLPIYPALRNPSFRRGLYICSLVIVDLQPENDSRPRPRASSGLVMTAVAASDPSQREVYAEQPTQSTGLSVGAKVGIFLGVLIFGLLLRLLWFGIRHRKEEPKKPTGVPASSSRVTEPSRVQLLDGNPVSEIDGGRYPVPRQEMPAEVPKASRSSRRAGVVEIGSSGRRTPVAELPANMLDLRWFRYL